jgi:hypothetical protein
MLDFVFPTEEELKKIGDKERLNVFRRYFAASRYNRLIIQQNLIRTAFDKSLISRVKELERAYNKDFFDTVRTIRSYGYLEEFLAAIKEEDEALQKIIEAYEKRMSNHSSKV